MVSPFAQRPTQTALAPAANGNAALADAQFTILKRDDGV